MDDKKIPNPETVAALNEDVSNHPRYKIGQIKAKIEEILNEKTTQENQET